MAVSIAVLIREIVPITDSPGKLEQNTFRSVRCAAVESPAPTPICLHFCCEIISYSSL